MHLERLSSAKINLLLNILGRRADGFHELETVMCPVAIGDRLRFETAPAGLALSCDPPSLPADGTNLVHRAATAFLETAGVRTGLRLELVKRVPLAAGLGGGSGDAAATLLGLNELFDRPLPPETLFKLAAGLGSDVPFFLQDAPALATGRGERVEPLGRLPALEGRWALLVHPGFGVATAWAYQALARFPAALNGEPGRGRRLIEDLRQPDLGMAARQFYNSLEAAVFDKYPVLGLYQEFFRAEGALATLMSGSGSTTFALVENEPAGDRLRERFQARFGAQGWAAVVPLGTGHN